MKTPRTTAFFESQHISVRETDLDRWEKMTEFARELERENTRLREALDSLQACSTSALFHTKDALKNSLRSDLEMALENARAALAVTPSC